MHSRRVGPLSGVTAQRLLDGGDGPSPLPELLAAATAPATAAELRGESAARAAFRSSTRPVQLSGELRRRSTVRVATAITIAKAVAAIALTAGTAGTIALATSSTPADPPARTTSESTATEDAASASLALTTPTPTGVAPAVPEGAGDGAQADEPGRSGSAGFDAAGPEARDPHSTGRCRASSNTATIDDPGCTDAAAADDAEATTARRTGPPTGAAGKPEKQTGKPDDAGRAAGGDEDTAEKPGKAVGQDAAHADKSNRGKSAEHRQDG